MVQHLLRAYVTDAVMAKANKESFNFKTGSMIPPDFSQKLLDASLSYGGVYKEQTLPTLFANGIDPSICRTIDRCSVDRCQATIKDHSYQAKSLLDLHGGQKKSALTEEGKRTTSIR